MSEEFKVLTDVEHIKLRPQMYIGSISTETHQRFLNGIFAEYSYVSGMVKIIEEIIDNSVDEAIRTDFKFANQIYIDISSDTVKVIDNGRGIPLEEVETPEGTKVPRAVLALTRPKAGSNFDDTNRITVGLNGVGSSLTNAFSNKFKGITGNGKEVLTLECSDGLSTIDYKTSKGKFRGTTIEFIPNFDAFDCDEISEVVKNVIRDRISALSVIFPLIKFIFNGSVSTNNFDLYAKKYGEAAIYKTKNTSIGFVPSLDGFKQISYANGLHTKSGGSHVEYIMDGICSELIPLIKRKYKLDVSKARIKEYITLILFTNGMNNLKFDSQTKERLTNTAGEVKNHIDIDLVKTAKELIKLDNLILPIIETELARKEAAEKAAANRAQKAANKAKVAKHIKANKSGKETGTILYLAEGDCVDENREVFTKDGIKKIKDIAIGDQVFTHNNRFRKVVSYSPSLKKGIKINGKLYSRKHKLYVYNTNTDTFEFTKTEDITKDHKLVSNDLIERGLFGRMYSVKLVNDGVQIGDYFIKPNKITHRFVTFDGISINYVMFKDLIDGDLVIL